MPAITDLLVDGNGTVGPREWSSQSSLSIDEPVSSPNDGDSITSSVGAVQTTSFTLQNTPSDFGTMDSLQLTLRHRCTVTGDDTEPLLARIMSGATVLAAADSGGTFQQFVADVNSTTFSNTGPTAFSHVNTTADKATWDAAEIEIQRGHGQSMGNDNRSILISALDLDGVYTASAPDINAPAGLAAGTGTAIQFEATVAPTGGLASGTGLAIQPEATVAPTGGLAAGTGTAPGATVETGVNTNAPAGLAAATGTAIQSEVTVTAAAGLAAATGIAIQSEATVGARAGQAAAAGLNAVGIIDAGDTATPPTDIVDAGDQATPPVDVYVGSDPFDTEATIAPSAELAAGIGTAPGATVQTGADVNAFAGLAAGTGTAPGATVETGTFTNALAGLAAASGAALAAVADIKTVATLALGAGEAKGVTTSAAAGPPIRITLTDPANETAVLDPTGLLALTSLSGLIVPAATAGNTQTVIDTVNATVTGPSSAVEVEDPSHQLVHTEA